MNKNWKISGLVFLGLCMEVAGRLWSRSTSFIDHPMTVLGAVLIAVALTLIALPEKYYDQGRATRLTTGTVLTGLIYILCGTFLFWVALFALLSIIYALVALPLLVLAIFFVRLTKALWRFSRWSWYAAVSVHAITLVGFVIGLLSLSAGQNLPTRYGVIVVNIAFILYLTPRKVRSRFLHSSTQLAG